MKAFADLYTALDETTKTNEKVEALRRYFAGAAPGDAYVAYSRQLTLTDDKGYGDSLWKGIDLYDQAGDLPRVVSALKVFINERPTDLLAASRSVSRAALAAAVASRPGPVRSDPA